MRRYDKGQIVGETDPPVPFEEWLAGQMQGWERLDTTDPYVVGRIQMLKEVERTWARGKELRAT